MKQLPFRVWCIWVGGQEMTEPRRACLQSIRENIGVPVTLITDDTLHEYVVKGYPIHPGYTYLSAVTKGDYIRTYMMHHYGGGYTDIKHTQQSWLPYFEELANNEQKWVCGYKEVNEGGVACLGPEEHELQAELRARWKELVGNCAFVCKSHTPFTEQWIQNLHRVMDSLLPKLQASPAKHPRDALGHWIHGSYSTFPIRWAQIAGCIFHPLCLQYSDRLLNTLPEPKFTEYM